MLQCVDYQLGDDEADTDRLSGCERAAIGTNLARVSHVATRRALRATMVRPYHRARAALSATLLW